MQHSISTTDALSPNSSPMAQAAQPALTAIAAPAIAAVDHEGLRGALESAFSRSADALRTIEATFQLFAERKYSQDINRAFMKSWHSTHLKMLPIYGLSCRLQQLAREATGEERDLLFTAASRNAETSYEDLNLEELGPLDHSELYERMASAICDGEDWKLDRFNVKSATQFKNWVRSNMLHQEIETGLLTNLFSEIYNHAEYTYSLGQFETILNDRMKFKESRAKELLTYIACHVTGGVEVEHFNCCLSALTEYMQTQGKAVDCAAAEQLFMDYLGQLGTIMGELSAKMNAFKTLS